VLLLVEDDPDHAFLVQRRLADDPALDLDVVHLTTAKEAADRLAAGGVHCVVLDLSLPDARGMQAVHAVREVAPTVPVVVLTGLDSQVAGLQALQVGAQDYLVKGQHSPDAVARAVLFAMERARREEAEVRQALLGEQLATREAQLEEAQRLARLGSWEWDVRSGEVVWSEQLCRLTGMRDVAGPAAFDRYLALVAEEDRYDAARLFSLEAAEDPPVIARHRLVRRDGAVRWVQGHMTAAGWDDEGRPVRVIGTMQDITEQKTAEDALAHSALHDGLTGLVNREVLLDRLRRVLVSRRPDGSVVAVVFLDLDQFKWVNDSCGHSAGDRLLVEVARRLEGVVDATDTLARFGGDEFVVLCEQVEAEAAAVDTVERLVSALSLPFTLEGDEVTVTASVGVAVAVPGTGADAELVVRDADIAMYRAKERGRARVEVFDAQMRERASARLQTQSDLSHALERSELEVHFQPVVDMRSGSVTGSEALVRWQHPVHGLLGPDAFVPHAEETGLIVALGAAVLAQACATTAGWNLTRTDPLEVAVNLSARQLADPQLAAVVQEALSASGLPAHLLCLEVTETVVMDDAEASSAVLGQLRDLGVRVAIDDFGTGYSSLAYLRSLPVDLLKVDRSFIAAVDDEGPGLAIVTAVLALARALDLGVVAEGVETVGQRAALSALGVPLAQGWLWGRAVPAEDAEWRHEASGVHATRALVLPPARGPHPTESSAPTRGPRT